MKPVAVAAHVLDTRLNPSGRLEGDRAALSELGELVLSYVEAIDAWRASATTEAVSLVRRSEAALRLAVPPRDYPIRVLVGVESDLHKRLAVLLSRTRPKREARAALAALSPKHREDLLLEMLQPYVYSAEDDFEVIPAALVRAGEPRRWLSVGELVDFEHGELALAPLPRACAVDRAVVRRRA